MKHRFLLILFLAFGISANAQIKNGIRISSYTDNHSSSAQVDFIKNHFDYVMTPVLSSEMRDKYSTVELLLYRSIRGAWADTSQFDWNHLDTCENMFCHSDSAVQDTSTRIMTIYSSYLMDGKDLISPDAPDATDHWMNYYAETASNQVYTYNYDGLFMDSAGHKLNTDELNDPMPWDYSSESWRDTRYTDLSFVKSYLPDKLVIFNGLHSGNGADSSLKLTDGGMWEDFVYDCNTGAYKGVGNWWNAITCMQNNRDIAKLILAVKKPGLVSNDTARIFVVASYFLVANENILLTLSDYSYNNTIQYYPEYDIDLGEPKADYQMLSDTLFMRDFTNGLVLVNPFSDKTKSYVLDKTYYKIYPIGGGIINEDGDYDGQLTYDTITGTVTIPPTSALILKDSVTATNVVTDEINELSLKYYPNPFKNRISIEFTLKESSTVSISIFNIKGQRVKDIVDNRILSANKHRFEWNSKSISGTYICVLTINGKRIVKEVVKD